MSRAVAAGASARRQSEPARPAALPLKNGYFEQTNRPLTCLAFLLPLIVFYELGTRWCASDPVSHVEQRIIAFSLMQQFFSLFGVTGKYMPAAAVVSILLACHVVRNDGWSTHLAYLGGMVLESAIYAIPLRALAMGFAHYLPLYPPTDKPTALLVLSVGAGVYEEMLFRFVTYAALSFVFIDVLQVRRRAALLLIVLISSLGFSAYHYLGSEVFEWRSFAFRTVAGIYFGVIFLRRGIGVTAGTHAAYDISTFAIHLLAIH
jgi:CAAX prenyl protease-like protein